MNVIGTIIGFQQRDRQDSQTFNSDTFCMLPVVSAQCVIGVENLLMQVYYDIIKMMSNLKVIAKLKKLLEL